MNFDKWTNREIADELAAWETGEGRRVPAHRFLRLYREYERRAGIVRADAVTVSAKYAASMS